MIRILDGFEGPGRDPLIDAMLCDRKRIFVDLLKWDVPVVRGEFEIDQFDGERAIYCIATDDGGRHLGSIRLLPTDRPHILGAIFPELCLGEVPCAANIWELSRGCLNPDLASADRLEVRNLLTSAVVEYALWRRIAAYTCIADFSWYGQILMLGWECWPLGPRRKLGRSMTGALRIDVDATTPDRLREAGTYRPCRIVDLDAVSVGRA